MKQKLRIALDMDGVVVDLNDRWKAAYRERAGLPEDYPLVIKDWDVATTFTEISKKECYDILNIENLFLDSPPIPGSVEGVRKLLKNENYDVYFLTAAKARTAYSEKIKWIKKRFGQTASEKIICVATGNLKNVFHSMFDVMIDDNYKNFYWIMAYRKPVECILMDADHNQDVDENFYHSRVYNWDDILDKIEEIWQRRNKVNDQAQFLRLK